MENDDVHDCALVMRDGDGDVEEAPEDAGVDDEKDAMATEMTGPDERTIAMKKHDQLTHVPFRTMRVGTSVRPTTSTNGWGSTRRDSHSNKPLLHENEATR